MTVKNLISVIFSVIFISAFSYGQKKINLDLLVETDAITQNNIPETCRFKDQEPGTSIIDYVTNVDLGDVIRWKVDPADGNSAKVRLVKFKHENGPKFFTKDSIPASMGRIKGKIAIGTPGAIEKYTLIIKVKKDNGNWVEYFIDPKLRMN